MLSNWVDGFIGVVEIETSIDSTIQSEHFNVLIGQAC